MITFHAAARKVTQPDGLPAYVPMVTLRADKGRMVGSKISQNGNTYTNEADAKAFAFAAAMRVALNHDFISVAA
jgi:hypothetical protein